MGLKMTSSEKKILAGFLAIVFQVIGMLYFFGKIHPRAWHTDCLLCCLIVAVILSGSAIVTAIQEATAALREASQLKVDKRHSEAVPPLSFDDEEFDFSKTEES